MSRAVLRALMLGLAVAAAAPALAEPDAGAPDAGAPDAGAPDAGPDDVTQGLPQAEPISFKAALDKAEVTLGDPFILSIEIRHAASETWQLPVRLEWDDFGVRSKKSDVSEGDPKVTHHRLELQAFNVGELEIPAIRLTVDTPQGTRVFELPPQKIKVNGVIDHAQGEPQMREDTRPLPKRWVVRWWPLALASLPLVVLLAWWLRRRWLARPKVAPPPKPLPPPEFEALQKLAVLEQEALVNTGRKHEYWFRLTEIVREYVGRRYRFEALEMTTDELLDELRRRPTPGLEFDGFARFLQRGDLVKFARSDATDGECKTGMDEARALVERTRPPPAPPGGGAP